MPDGAICGKPVGRGAVQYRCTLPPHENNGPCVAVEIPSSRVAREAWQREQIAAGIDNPIPESLTASAPVVAPEPQLQDGSISSTTGEVFPQSHGFSDHESRVGQAMQSMHAEYEHLPTALKSWTMGAAAQLSLVDLWRVFKASGHDEILLTREDVEALVPPKLRT